MTQKEFQRRRRQLMELMGEQSVAILPAAPVRYRNRDVEYPYRQDSDFYYLTGFPEPEAVMVLVPGRAHGEYILFCREKDEKMEIWHGKRAGQEGAVAEYGADDSFPIDDIDDILPGLLEDKTRVFHTMGAHPDFDQRVIGWVNRLRKLARAGVHTPGEFISLDHHLHEMRLFKSAAELKAMRKAAEISVQAHIRAMQTCRPGLKEYQIAAELNYVFQREGAAGPAYESIVGGGANACVLHYVTNRDTLRKGDLLLIDAGAEYDYYAADISRTFPVSGRFSRAQRSLYDLVLEAQQAAIEAVKPGKHWNEPHEAAVRVLTEGMVKLGLLKGSVNRLIEQEKYRRFYMHRTGHWLGMDVHDVGDYKVDDEWRLLEPGMVLTIEPGLYVTGGDAKVPRKFWNTGIRIEDDVLVTKDGCEVLTEDAPKDPADIEAVMAG